MRKAPKKYRAVDCASISKISEDYKIKIWTVNIRAKLFFAYSSYSFVLVFFYTLFLYTLGYFWS